jgi:hypothetical protein
MFRTASIESEEGCRQVVTPGILKTFGMAVDPVAPEKADKQPRETNP